MSSTQEVLDELLLREFLKNHPQKVTPTRGPTFYLTLFAALMGFTYWILQ